jgi:hypothetical protein
MHVPNLFSQLAAPFPPDQISWRVGTVFNKDGTESTAMVLAYLDARDVMDRLDEIVGPENWQCEYTHAHTKTVCKIGIKVAGEWVWKADGAGDSDVEAEKGALSDAFKRAAVRWGIGRYLYTLGDTKAKVQRKNTTSKFWYIPDSEISRLRKVLPSPSAKGPQKQGAVEVQSPASAAPANLPAKIDSPEALDELERLFENAQSPLQLKALGLKYKADLHELEDIAPEAVAQARTVYTARMEALS